MSQGGSAQALRIRGLEVRAPAPGGAGATILSGIDWQLEAGQRGVIVGASGSGKSRLLRVLNRLDEPGRGEVEVLGRRLQDWPPGELRRQVGWVPQRPVLMDGTGRECLEVVSRLGLMPAGQGALDPCLALVGLDPAVLERDVSQLSGGERHRLAMARALLLQPRMLLLDEPTSALDGAGAARLLAHLMDWQARTGATLVVVTHRIDDARALGGHMLALVKGRVARAGPTRELIEQPRPGAGEVAGEPGALFDVRELLTGERASGDRAEAQP